MKYVDDLILLGAGAVVLALVIVFAPRPVPAAEFSPAHRLDAGDIVIVADGALVNINRADEALLSELPGVGGALARAIIDGRPYAAIEDLLRVNGIGQSKLDALRGHVTVR